MRQKTELFDLITAMYLNVKVVNTHNLDKRAGFPQKIPLKYLAQIFFLGWRGWGKMVLTGKFSFQAGCVWEECTVKMVSQMAEITEKLMCFSY